MTDINAEMIRLSDLVAQLQRENAELRKDAERYRWLRQSWPERSDAVVYVHIVYSHHGVNTNDDPTLFGAHLDEAIDAAMAAKDKS
jgi:hypothetical protein